MVGEGINLIPEEYGQKLGGTARVRKVSLLCILALLALGLALVGSFLYRQQVGAGWAFVLDRVEERKEQLNQEKNLQLEGKLRLVKGKVQYLGEFFATRQEYSGFVEELMTLFPTGVSMASLEQKAVGEELSFRGQAGNVQQVDEFIDELERWKIIESVTLRTCDFEVEDSRVTFSLLIKQAV